MIIPKLVIQLLLIIICLMMRILLLDISKNFNLEFMTMDYDIHLNSNDK